MVRNCHGKPDRKKCESLRCEDSANPSVANPSVPPKLSFRRSKEPRAYESLCLEDGTRLRLEVIVTTSDQELLFGRFPQAPAFPILGE